jgi:regulatory protein
MQANSSNSYKKIQNYCAYQERSHYQVREKLYSYGLHKQEVETLISKLLEEGFLNEERFATAFARGKFKLKHWGKIKIRYALQQQKVSIYNIQLALQAIEHTEYLSELQKLAERKWEQLSSQSLLLKRQKLMAYLQQKGFERNYILMVLDTLKNTSLSS